jgi:anti-anti-sigma factor
MAGLETEVLADDTQTAIIAVRGDLDIATTDQLEDAVGPILRRNPTRLVLDLSALEFADSSAIAQWVRWAATVHELELRNPPELIRRVITSMGLAGTLQMTP